MSAEHDFQWYLERPDAYEALTVEQIHELGIGGIVPFGETEPAKAAEETSGSPAADDKAPVEITAKVDETPVVQAKDGKNIIPFSELEDARAKAAQFEQLSKDQASLIEEMKAAKDADKGTGATEAQDEVMSKFKDNYPELFDSLAPAMQKMIDAGVNAKVEALEKKLNDALLPLQKTALNNSVDAHFDAIHSAIPDFDKLVESGSVIEWVKSLPSFARVGAEAVLASGTAEEVIELFAQYKSTLKTETTKPADTKEQIKAKADEVIAKASKKTVTSLTDIPASSGTEANEDPTDVKGWSRKFATMTPEQIRKELSR